MTMEGTLCEKRSRCYSTIHPCHLVVTFVNTIGRTSTMDMGYATDGNDQPPDPIGINDYKEPQQLKQGMHVARVCTRHNHTGQFAFSSSVKRNNNGQPHRTGAYSIERSSELLRTQTPTKLYILIAKGTFTSREEVHAAGAGADADTGAGTGTGTGTGAGTGTGTGTGAIGRAGSTVSATATATVLFNINQTIVVINTNLGKAIEEEVTARFPLDKPQFRLIVGTQRIVKSFLIEGSTNPLQDPIRNKDKENDKALT
uniref:Uncharacterized protein n=1 Tax=Vespula pensylvanica TaxID=30213 RepID=A0A834KMK9_VESPE|nr:hypothetical protein H0235_014427 [Vespula pensylvanica]